MVIVSNKIRYFVKSALFFLLNFGKVKNKATILMYHSIGDNDAFFSVTKNNFYQQLTYLKNNNFKVVKISELVTLIKEKKDISKHVCLTFDDGYEDNITLALPILREFNYPATIFIATGLLGKNFTTSDKVTLGLISEADIRSLGSGLIEFMPHSVNHLKLDKISPVDYDREIGESRQFLENITGGTSAVLAYPQGRFTEEIVSYLKSNDWLGAVTVQEGLVSVDDDVFTLKRNSIDSSTSFWQFRGKLGPAIERYNKLKRFK